MAKSQLAHITIPITKRDKNDDGSVTVRGIVTDDSLDLDGQIVDATSAAKALQNWFDEWANIRQQHSPLLAPAGKGISLDFEDGVPYLTAKIIEPTAVKLVNEGVYQAFSIGIADGELDTSPMAKQKAKNGILFPSLINEVSVVDYPANTSCKFVMGRKRKGQPIEIVEAVKVFNKNLKGLTGDEFVKALKGLQGGEIVATCKSHQEALALRESSYDPNLFEVNDNVIITKRKFDPSVGGGVDREKIPGKDFAGKNRSFPIVTPGDVSDAASSIGRAGKDNYSSDQLKENIIAIAKRKGPEFVKELPEKWKAEMKDSKKDKAEAKKAAGRSCSACDGTGTCDNGKCGKCKGTGMLKAKKAKLPKVDADVTDALRTADASLHDAMNAQSEDNAAHRTGADADDPDKKKAKKGKKGMEKKDVPQDADVDQGDDDPDMDDKKKGKKGKKGKDDKFPMKKAEAQKMQKLHDLVCPACATKSVSRRDLTQMFDQDIFSRHLAELATKKADAGSIHEASQAFMAANHVAQIAPKDAAALARLAHKSYQDSYPNLRVSGPDLKNPGSFQRGFLPGANDETASTMNHPSNFPKPNPLEAGDYQRGPLTTNETRPSLVGGTPAVDLVTKGASMFYPNADKDASSAAMAKLHDHIVSNYPALCPAGNELANEGASRISTPLEMYAEASPVKVIDTFAGSTLHEPQNVAAASKSDKKKLRKQTLSVVKSEIAKVTKSYDKKVARLEKKLKDELKRPDEAQAARRMVQFAPTHKAFASAEVDETKRERVQRARELSKRIHDRNSDVSHAAIVELQELVSPDKFAALMTADGE